MKLRYRLFQRSNKVYYIEDTITFKQESLKTKDKNEAQRLMQAKNEAHQQPALNFQLARTYLAASDPEIVNRKWSNVMDAIVQTKTGVTKERWLRAIKDHALDLIRDQRILDTHSEHFLAVLESGTVTTNVYLRRLHNFALDMNWLSWPLIPKKQWPSIKFKSKRAITAEEHQKIISIEWDAERRAYYELLWHLGGAQSDVASLRAEDIDWKQRVIAYSRKKTKATAILHFSETVEIILKGLPSAGPLFPRIFLMHEKHRAAEFKRRCRRLRIEGVTLHSYRYSWAERASA